MNSKNSVLPGCGYHHVAIRATDFDGTMRFYTEGFGFRPAVRWGEGDGRAVLLDTGDGNYLEVFAGGKRAPGEPVPVSSLPYSASGNPVCQETIGFTDQFPTTAFTALGRSLPNCFPRPTGSS